MEGVIQKTAQKPGKTVAILGGVHGNERVGIDALRWAQDTVVPEAGTVYFIEANPLAIQQNVRFVDKNMNRCFIDAAGDSAEAMRAKEIMQILGECDASLDIHASNSKIATPFVTCEAAGLPIAQLFDVPIISTGWDALEPGTTDEYMNRNGKIGLCIECGSVHDSEASLPLAKESVLRFLRYFGIISGESAPVSVQQRRIDVHFVAHKGEDALTFTSDFKDFELLPAGEVFAQEGEKTYRASEGDCIIFPRPNAPVGAEAFILGKEVR